MDDVRTLRPPLLAVKLVEHFGAVLRRRALFLRSGIDQPKISALLNGRLANFSSERLMHLLTALGQDVEIMVKTKPRNRAHGRIKVIGDAHA
jgi:hypothetical protein